MGGAWGTEQAPCVPTGLCVRFPVSPTPALLLQPRAPVSGPLGPRWPLRPEGSTRPPGGFCVGCWLGADWGGRGARPRVHRARPAGNGCQMPGSGRPRASLRAGQIFQAAPPGVSGVGGEEAAGRGSGAPHRKGGPLSPGRTLLSPETGGPSDPGHLWGGAAGELAHQDRTRTLRAAKARAPHPGSWARERNGAPSRVPSTCRPICRWGGGRRPALQRQNPQQVSNCLPEMVTGLRSFWAAKASSTLKGKRAPAAPP